MVSAGEVCFTGLTDVSELELRATEMVWDGQPGRCNGVELYPCSSDAAGQQVMRASNM